MSDPRWIVLVEDGSYSTLGRAVSEAEMADAERAFVLAGQRGWFAVMSGSPHARRAPDVEMLRPINAPQTAFADAVAALRRRGARAAA